MTQALDTATLLVDQHRRMCPDRLAALRHKLGDLGRRAHIAVEQNETPRRGLAQETALAGRQREA